MRGGIQLPMDLEHLIVLEEITQQTLQMFYMLNGQQIVIQLHLMTMEELEETQHKRWYMA